MININVTSNELFTFGVGIHNAKSYILRGVKEITRENARDMHLEMLRMMLDDPKTGRIYIRKGGRRHQASAAGQSPAFDTGAYANSIQIREGDGGMQQNVFTNIPYAKWLEGGTENMEARPLFAPALSRQKEIYLAQLKQFIEGV